MKKYTFTIGLFDKDTEKQEIKTSLARTMLDHMLLESFGIFAYTCWECSGVYVMQSTGEIIHEPSLRIEIASDEAIPAADIVVGIKRLLNQETVMLEVSESNIQFI